MQTYLKPVFYFIVITLFSCSKYDFSYVINHSLIKKVIYNSNAYTYLYYYNNQNNLISIKSTFYSTYDTFIYYGDTIIVNQNNNIGGIVLDSTVYLLNKMGLADSSIGSVNQGYNIKYFYDAYGYLKIRKWYSKSNELLSIDSLFVENGNTIRTVYTDIKGNGGVIEKSFYDLKKINTVSNSNFGKSFLGTDSKNLITRLQYEFLASDFQYSFDESGRVRTRTQIADGNIIGIDTFEYY